MYVKDEVTQRETEDVDVDEHSLTMPVRCV